MALKDWKRKRSKNPYVEKIYINDKKKLMLEIYYDIGFGEQRNVNVSDLTTHNLSGFRSVKTIYCHNKKEAKQKAEEYMRYN
mgnify:CR=1 FL=1|jgi:hypothetical protein